MVWLAHQQAEAVETSACRADNQPVASGLEVPGDQRYLLVFTHRRRVAWLGGVLAWLAGVVALGPHGLRPVAVAMFIAAGVMLVASGVLSRLLKTLAAPDSFEAPPFLFSKAYLVEWRRRRQAKRELAASPFGR